MKLRFTAKATADVDEVFKYIAADNPTAALGVIRKLDRAIEGLLENPERGRFGRVLGTRELVVPGAPYIVAYTIRDQTIQILAVLHGARAWPTSFGV